MFLLVYLFFLFINCFNGFNKLTLYVVQVPRTYDRCIFILALSMIYVGLKVFSLCGYHMCLLYFGINSVLVSLVCLTLGLILYQHLAVILQSHGGP